MTTTKWSSLRKQAEDATRPLPDDWYELEVTKSQLKTASTGSLMISLQFKVTDGPQHGKGAFTNLVFSPDSAFALNIFFRNLACFGFDGAFFDALEKMGYDVEPGLEVVAEQMVGRRVRAEVGIRQWSGQDRNEIRSMATPTVPNPPVAVPTGPPTPGGAGPASGPPVPSLGGSAVGGAPSSQPAGVSALPTPTGVGSAAPPVPSF